MFNVGDIVTGKLNNRYSITTSKALMLVVDKIGNNTMYVVVLAHIYKSPMTLWRDDKSYRVYENEFISTTIDEYFSTYPNSNRLEDEYIKEITEKYGVDFSWNNSETEVATRSYAEDEVEPYILSDEQRKTLIKEMTELLKEYNYHPTKQGLNTILDEWVKNKGNLIRLFEKHPNYNGKFQIVFDTDYERVTDKNAIQCFIKYLHNSNIILEEYKIHPFSYKEAKSIFNKYDRIVDYFDHEDFIESINGLSYDQACSEKNKWRNICNRYETLSNREVFWANRNIYTRESANKFEAFREIISKFVCYYSNLLNDEMVDLLNHYCPKLKAVVGQKTSRVINKLCKLFGVDKLPDYNKMFAQYSDAINPLTVKRHTILSVHPIDYYTMSFGNSWASCHTIDKENKRGMENSYHGQYSGGTESYMLDGTSIVFYTVDKTYNGNEYELQPKINRNMFHFGKNKLIQGRVYPQANDDDGGIYTTIREIVQKIMSECLESENSWLNVKGMSECCKNISTKGVHYKDYASYDACNVSYYRKEKDFTRITVGHNPICPCCGDTHAEEDCIECYDCR